jgi:hypothetical protein
MALPGLFHSLAAFAQGDALGERLRKGSGRGAEFSAIGKHAFRHARIILRRHGLMPVLSGVNAEARLSLDKKARGSRQFLLRAVAAFFHSIQRVQQGLGRGCVFHKAGIGLKYRLRGQRQRVDQGIPAYLGVGGVVDRFHVAAQALDIDQGALILENARQMNLIGAFGGGFDFLEIVVDIPVDEGQEADRGQKRQGDETVNADPVEPLGPSVGRPWRGRRCFSGIHALRDSAQ